MGLPVYFELLALGLVCCLFVGFPLVIVFIVLSVDLRHNPLMPINHRPCPDCSAAVSVYAATCPHCGCSLKDDP